jgi:hypothetical protein
MNHLNNYDKRVQDKKRSVKREEEEEKCTLLVSRHVECNSLDDH